MSQDTSLWQDTALNDEDTSGLDLREKLMQAAGRLGGLMTQPSAAEVNGFHPRDWNVALLPVHFKCAVGRQLDLKRKEKHLDGSRWQVSMCSFSKAGVDDKILYVLHFIVRILQLVLK